MLKNSRYVISSCVFVMHCVGVGKGGIFEGGRILVGRIFGQGGIFRFSNGGSSRPVFHFRLFLINTAELFI